MDSQINGAGRAVAVVGLGAILPDALNPNEFWKNILDKRYSIIDTPADRWCIADYYDPDPSVPDKTYSKIGSWIRGFEFDWKKHRMPPRVAAALDPSQQWAVTMTAQALADSGYPERPLDTERTAVILGTAMGGQFHYNTYRRAIFPEFGRAIKGVPEFRELDPQLRATILSRSEEIFKSGILPITEDSMPGELPNIVAGRVANVFNLRGPNFIIDAACASSCAAVDAAIALLVEGRADAVVTGGVDHNMDVSSFIKFCKIGALSATGTRPFGEGADGFVMGEGGAAFLLKRLEDAERAGDKIYAVIRGVGGASDGKGKGITAPNPIGQQLAVRRAWENAGLDPATATMVEAHGTSTKVGDVVEVESLAAIFGGAPRGHIALGSVKSNFGHLKAGAGAAGLLKAVLALHNKVIPPTLNAEMPNPDIDFAHSPFRLATQLEEWKATNGTPRRCGVSAYGFGGTNFHIVLEEYVPGMLKAERRAYAGVQIDTAGSRKANSQLPQSAASLSSRVENKPDVLPPRGILMIGAASAQELAEKLQAAVSRVKGGWIPPIARPALVDIRARERLVIDFGDRDELLDRLSKAQKALSFDNPAAWRALQAQGIFRGSGPKPGKVAFLFPGQGSQYLNMGRELAALYPIITETIAEGDRVMSPVLGKPLSSFVFTDVKDPAALKRAELELTDTAICQPAMLTLDTGIYRLLGQFGFRPDMVMGHSLGEYGALIAAGIMPFHEAVEAAAARGHEMSTLNVPDKGWMAAVMAPYEVIEQTLKQVDGYVSPANINSQSQSVIGGASKAVEQAIALFARQGIEARRLPVSHAFHTSIVAPASAPLRKLLDRLEIALPQIPVVGNVNGEFYPNDVEGIKGLLERQIASPVQWVKGLETLYAAGARAFVEVGPKKALKGLVDDVLGNKPDVVSLFTNHPKVGEVPSLNQALCGLCAAGYGDQDPSTAERRQPAAEPAAFTDPGQAVTASNKEVKKMGKVGEAKVTASDGSGHFAAADLKDALAQALAQLAGPAGQRVYDRHEPPLGSIVISGTGLGLPGTNKPVMDPDNAMRILRGEQFVDLIPERFRKRMLAKRVTRVVKAEDGSGRFETITEEDDVIRLAGRPGPFDLAEEYGVPAKLIEALDATTQLAMAAGLDALREAGIPLVQSYKRATTGKLIPDRWMLPEALRDETGVIFASAFPGMARFSDEMERYFTWQNRQDQYQTLDELRRCTDDAPTLAEINRRMSQLRDELEREPYEFDRRFLLRVLSMGHSQFAEYIGARGPNTQVNAACASTAQAIGLAEDWIRNGRARRVIVLAADDATGDNLIEWIGAGFLASGAAATDDHVQDAALPFDKRRHGTLMGMGSCALVVESEDAVRERGMRGIVELLSSVTNNSAFHGTRLDVDHISGVMNDLVTSAERRFGINRFAIAPETVFMSHETYTPARGGSASAEVVALRKVFGASANDIIVANTKGFTGHPMGVGIEDVIALKILEYGIVPPIPNFKEVDPELGTLNFSRGGRYPVRYALHLAAGFGSQIAMTMTRRIPGGLERVDNKLLYDRWLADVSGYDRAETEVVKRVLRLKANGAPTRAPAPSQWRPGTGPSVRTLAADGQQPATSRVVQPQPAAYTPAPQPAKPAAEAARQPEAAAQPITVSPSGNGKSGLKAAAAAADKQAPAVAGRPQIDGGRTTDDGGRVATVDRPSTIEKPQVEPVQPQEASPEPRAAAEPSPAAGADQVAEKVLSIVADKTGYPRDMLALDLDLEADLGIDTVKQAETFAAIRQEFDLPRRENLKLRDYPTLAKVIQFVEESRPDLAAKDQGRAIPKGVPCPRWGLPGANDEPSQSNSLPSGTTAAGAQAKADDIAEHVLAIVAAKTGYPRDMLDLDLDLEADLGIDTVKQAETFAAIRQEFELPRRENLKLRDYPTLAKVIEFVKQSRPDAGATKEEETRTEDEPSDGDSLPSGMAAVEAQTATDDVADKVLEIVANKTGYPREMLDLDLDLEADLGIDTVKQAETFAAIRQEFGLPRRENLKLRDYPTLAKVIEFVKEAAGEQAAATAPFAKSGQVIAAAPKPAATKPALGSIEKANEIPRRVPVPVLRPVLELCKPTGVTLNDKSRVVVMPDKGGAGSDLVTRLQQLGATVLVLEPELPTEILDGRIKAWLADGPIQGVYWLPALDVEPDIEEQSAETWHELNRVRVKNLYTAMRALYEAVSASGTFLVTATRLGGLHGYGPDGATAPLGGAVTGFAKAYKRERPEVTVKAVDFDGDTDLAVALIGETQSDPGVVEVGYWNGSRFGISLEERPVTEGRAGLTIDANTVFVVTGAAGGITSAIIADLAAASAGKFYLLDLVPAPEPNDPHVALFRSDKEALKARLIEEAKAEGERPTPARIDKQILAVERSEAALRAVESVQAAGGKAYYRAVNLLDGPAVRAVVDEIREREGRIDVIVHAGGIEISRALGDKDPKQFDLVFDVKADGFFHLLNAAKGMPIGATVVFSSVAGRFGNSGQTDYSSANDLLCKITSSLRRWRPETRGIAIDWTAWGGIGMATRGSIPKIMEMAGIEVLPPESGIPTVRRELTAAGDFRGEVVVAGKLGIMTQEWDEHGGLDPDKAREWRCDCRPEPLMVGQVKRFTLYGGLEAETTLDPKEQPFLHDHAMSGTPLLPGVMGVETFAEVACILAPDYEIAAVENVEYQRPFKFHRMQPQTLHLRATVEPAANAELLAHVTLKSVTVLPRSEMPPQEKLHFAADVRLTRRPHEQPGLAAVPSFEETREQMERGEIYKIYFHGPAYQVLERVGVNGVQAIGLFAENLPPNASPAESTCVMAPRLVELCFQTAGMWEIKRKGVMALPLGIRSVAVFRQPEEADGMRLYARTEAINDGAEFNAEVVDENGNVYVKVNGYRTVELLG